MTAGVILSLLAAGLAILLARENKLRRALQALCNRLLARLSETTSGSSSRSSSAVPQARRRHARTWRR